MSDNAWVYEAADATALGELSETNRLMGVSGNVIGAARPLDHGLNEIIRNAELLGLVSKDTIGPLEVISSALMFTSGAFMAYNAVRAMVLALSNIEKVLAAAEAAAAIADPLMWPNLIIATGAMVATYGAIQFASGEWNFSGVDVNDPSQRAQAADKLKGVASSG